MKRFPISFYLRPFRDAAGNCKVIKHAERAVETPSLCEPGSRKQQPIAMRAEEAVGIDTVTDNDGRVRHADRGITDDVL